MTVLDLSVPGVGPGTVAPTADPVPHGGTSCIPPPTLVGGGGIGCGHNAFPIYRHGFSVRIGLDLPKADAVLALSKAGYDPTSKDWRGKGATKTLRGTAWLTARKPRNRTLPLALSNEWWGTCLYGLGVEERPTGFLVDLTSVREADVKILFETVMGLTADQYAVAYYRRAERFMCLTPEEAFAFQDALEGHAGHGKGRTARKFNLLKDHPIPVVTGKRTKTMASLTMYRIKNGATHAFKAEVMLAGKRRDRGTFTPADVTKLEGLLVELVNAHDLHPIAKPDRWEPREADEPRWPMDPNLSKLPAVAWRGNPLDAGLLANCHTLEGVSMVDSLCRSGGYPHPARIRNGHPSSPSPSLLLSPTTTTPSVSPSTLTSTSSPSPIAYEPEPRNPKPHYQELVNEITHTTGTLTEIILDGSEDPIHFVACLRDVDPSTVVSVLKSTGSDSWASLVDDLENNPLDDEATTWVVVVDPSVMGAAGATFAHRYDPETEAFLNGDGEWIDPVTGEMLLVVEPKFEAGAGPACRHGDELVNGSWRSETRALAAVLWEPLAGMRDVCERTGLRVVLVSVDCRPDHGRVAKMSKSHFFRDTRVRSSLGDAGRHWAHARYAVQGRTVVTWKDELEGRTGRIIYKPHPWNRRTGKGYGRHRF